MPVCLFGRAFLSRIIPTIDCQSKAYSLKNENELKLGLIFYIIHLLLNILALGQFFFGRKFEFLCHDLQLTYKKCCLLWAISNFLSFIRNSKLDSIIESEQTNFWPGLANLRIFYNSLSVYNLPLLTINLYMIQLYVSRSNLREFIPFIQSPPPLKKICV